MTAKPKTPRVKPARKYTDRPELPGAYWVEYVKGGREVRADVRFKGIKFELHAKIFGVFKTWIPITLLRQDGWIKWRKRALKAQPAARWHDFAIRANARLVKRGGLQGRGPWAETIAGEIFAGGEGEAFLKSARRGRGTQRQNVRYQILREVERLMGDAVPRRREAANIPDALALKQPADLKLEGE